MKNVKVKEVRGLINEHPSLIGANAPAVQAAEAILKNPRTRTVYIVDREKHLLGSINVRSLIRFFLPEMFEIDITGGEILKRIHVRTVRELISGEPAYVTEDDDLHTTLKVMIKNEMDELPVVDEEKRVIGEVNILEILSIWLIRTQG
ncbi:hypothetical protein DRP53_08510 [candidate division WOR-3 bacterium]|uniref:CBS domain-containing protein n=1 Tax=candidate division WOR-3 bacterium TaxID=2052148 RepID=A0A660SEW6_UNCW3|nr:MAG: hypothetical protein DRP53_08510 [candidate division WOR-3 bacterium]